MNRLVALASLSVALTAGAADLVSAPAASAAPLLAKSHGEKALMNVVETAAADPRFSTLVAAVQAAGLQDALATTANITVFAPTNDAFAALPAGTLESLLLPENRAQLTIEVADGGVTVGGASVIATDVKASNGVIHVVDRVILPPTN